MNNKTLYLLRHGLATHSKTGYGDKILTASLLPEGIASSKRIGEYFKDKETDYNVSSEVLRCRQTAAIIQEETNKHFVFDKRLNESPLGPKEPFPELHTRASEFVNDVQSSNYQSILICTHGILIAAIKHFVLDGNFDASEVLDYPPTGTLAVLKNRSFEVIDFN